MSSSSFLTPGERQWIIDGLAWVGLRRWMYGLAAGEAARIWFEQQLDQRFSCRQGIYLTPAMSCLEVQYAGRMQSEAGCRKSSADPSPYLGTSIPVPLPECPNSA